MKIGRKFWKYVDLYLAVDYLKTFDVFHELSDMDKVRLSVFRLVRDLFI